jgi:hypothetical protein
MRKLAPGDGDIGPQFSSPDWSMQVVEDDGMNESRSYHADVFRKGTFVCRIALAGKFTELAAAEAALAERVHEWLRDYEGRLAGTEPGTRASGAEAEDQESDFCRRR